jgi:GntR family transcriptional regulator, transcriptional repressor for pyruvate dehydrogenase complex
MVANGGRSGKTVEKVDVPRAADVLVAQLRDLILSGYLPVGELLPPERALVEQTGLGRVSVREALRILEVDQLIEPRHGRYGGWVVRQPGPESVARTIDVFIRGRDIDFGSLLATREAIEPACAALAARQRTDEDIRALEEHNRLLADADIPEYLLENLRWHRAVVDATHNELLIAFMSALSSAIHAATDLGDFNSTPVRHAAHAAHESVLRAIRKGDEQAAYRAMYRHLHAFRVQVGAASTS